jgi:hypothetical protein
MKTILLLLLALTAQAQRQNLIAEYTFDTLVGNWGEKTMHSDCSIAIASNARRGKSLRMTLIKGEGMRTELGTLPINAPQEGWYGFSLFFPETFENDVNPESIVQWHSFPDKGEEWRSAPLFIGTLNGNLILEQRTDSVKITNGSTITYKRDIIAALEKGVWSDYVVHAKWSHKSDGLLEIWKDDKLIFTKKGANCYNDTWFPFFKIGIYSWDFTKSKMKTDTRVIYIDEVRLGNAKATYNDVYSGRKLIKTVLYYSDGTTEIK